MGKNMLRRVLVFAVLVAGGIGFLTLVVGEDDFLKLGNQETEAAESTQSPGGIDIGTKQKRGGREGRPSGARVLFRGRGSIQPSQGDFRLATGKVLSPPEFRLAWVDAEPRPDGMYRLRAAKLTLFEKYDPRRPDVRTVVELNADSMDVMPAQDENELVLDEAHAVTMRDVVIDVLAASLSGTTGTHLASDTKLRLETALLRARFENDALHLETDQDEFVRMATAGKPAGSLDFTLEGNGLVADLVRLDPEPDPEHPRSRIIMRRNVVMRGIDRVGGRPRFTLTSSNKLDLFLAEPDLWLLDLHDDVRFEGRLGASRGRRPLVATGDRLRAWIRRGITQPNTRTGQLSMPALTDLLLRGSKSKPAELQASGQRLVARELAVEFDPVGKPGLVTGRGVPMLELFDAKGAAIGRVRAATRITWRRPIATASAVLRGFGFDLARELGATSIGHAVFPEELFHADGPAVFESARDSGLDGGRADGGMVVCAARQLGRVEPFVLEGLGNVHVRGRLADPQGTPWTASGNKGFTLARDVTSATLHVCVGPKKPDPAHEFRFESGRYTVAGRGWVFLEAAEHGPDYKLRFSAALRESLAFVDRDGRGKTTLRGVKSFVAQRHGGDPVQLTITGIPLEFESSRTGVSATAEVVERHGEEPWRLGRGPGRVTVVLPAEGKRPVLRLAADEAHVRQMRAWGSTDRSLYLVRADGRVRAQTRTEDGSDIVLTCDQLVRYPRPERDLVDGIVGAQLGGAGRRLAPIAFGGGSGIMLARGAVIVEVRQPAGDPANGVVAVRRVEGGSLRLDLDRGLGRFLMLPASGDVVTGTIDQPGRGRITLVGDRLVGRGRELLLGGRGTSQPLVFVRSERTGRNNERLLLRAGGAVRLVDEMLEVPGPLRAESVDARGSPVAGGFFLTCTKDLRLFLANGTKPHSARFALPATVQRAVARGDVDMGYRAVRAHGSVLSFEPATGWLELTSTKAPVRVSFRRDYRMELTPRLRINLLTREWSAGRSVASGRLSGTR